MRHLFQLQSALVRVWLINGIRQSKCIRLKQAQGQRMISSVFHYQIKSAHWFLIGCSNISFLIVGCQVFWPARVYSTPKPHYREQLVEKSYWWRLCPSEPSGPQCSYLRPESDVKVAISGNLSENIPRQGPSAHLAHGYSSNKTERSISLKVLI